MTSPSSRRIRLALAVAIAVVAAGASVMAAVVAHPKSVASRVMGSDWQCQQLMWLTTCTYVGPVTPIHKVHVDSRDV
ncbi:hypothetical protein ACQR1W_01710 [Bradyrhizobium sp. HKCCYLS1011]|uniref:hypothetical protein n=1 Tax=Bradyrhizobium sp. HKCCYLS1011 TaxID=3420733 RepID=UPI003EBDB0FB